MEKSRSRITNPEIIDSWKFKSRSRIVLESFLTLAFWSGFTYLLAPIVTLILWLFGVQITYFELMGSKGLMELLKIIKGGFFIMSIVTICIMTWGYYNYLLFRIRGERRNSQVRICFDEDFSTRFQLDLETLQAAKKHSCLSVTLTDDGMQVNPVSGLASPSLTILHGRQRTNFQKEQGLAGASRS